MEGRKRQLDQDVQRISKELRLLLRKRTRDARVRISKAQESTARALMMMRAGEPTAAMAFLRSKHEDADANATRWDDVESDLRAWCNSADEDTRNRHAQIGATNEEMHSAIRRAQRFIADEDLEAWVVHQNVHKGINPRPATTLREANLVKQHLGVEAPRTHRGARQWLRRWRRRRGLRLRRFPALEPMEKKDMHGKAGAQTDAEKKGTHPLLPPLELVVSKCKKKRPFSGRRFKAALREVSRTEFQKTAAIFWGVPVFSRCLQRDKAEALWRWSNFLQSIDPPERERVLINMDETSVRLVPEEGRGHVSKRAYRLFVQGVPMGRRASLAARRSNITHVAAICNNPRFQTMLPQLVLVGANQVSEARLAALRSSLPEYGHIWRHQTGWMTAVIMVKYVRLLGRCLKDFKASHRFVLFSTRFGPISIQLCYVPLPA